MRIIGVSVVACVAVEYLIQKYLLKGDVTINDGSAVITGVLLAFNVPANLPTWIIIIGAIFAIAIAKMAFGGLGKNPFNPALVGRVFFIDFVSCTNDDMANTKAIICKISNRCVNWRYSIRIT